MTDEAVSPLKLAPRHLFTLLADDIRQEMGGKTSLMGLYDHHIVVPETPFVLPKVCFYTRFGNIKGKYLFGFGIVSPKAERKDIIKGSEIEIPEGSTEGTFNVIASPFEVLQEGVYEVYITLQQGDDAFEYVYKFAISDAKRLQAEYEAAKEPAVVPDTVQ